MDTDVSATASHAPDPTHSITPSGSPFVYQNLSQWPENVIVTGGTVTAIAFSRDGIAYVPTGILGGQVMLGPKDYIKVTYLVAPSITGVPL